MTITLYFAPFTRATRPRWLLEELGVPYDLKVVDTKAGEHKTKQFKDEVHPLGALPALKDGDDVIVESGAIVAYLADKFADKGLAPKLDDKLRGKYLEWLFFAYATIEPAIIAIAAHNPASPAHSAPTPERIEKEKARFAEIIAVVEKAVSKHDFLLPTGFSAADVLIGSQVMWAASMKLIERDSALSKYIERCKGRPAWSRSR